MNATLVRNRTEEIYQRSCRVIPFGVNSPVRAFSGLGQTPIVIDAGYGDKIVDVDGNTFIDFCCSWGALIHGHAHPRIVEKVQKQVAMGSSFGTVTALESILAQKIVEHVPSVETLRFVTSGTEATMSAIRLARGVTKRDLIVKFSGHYHGHADTLLASCSAGVLQGCIEKTLEIPFNDFEACRTIFKRYGTQIAALIVEPIAANMGVVLPKEGFLQLLREKTEEVGALLIFDEVITGFRVALGGAQQLYEIEPDLTCFGKIVGGGFPAAAFGGKKEIMEYLAPLGPVYQAGTFSGNPVSMQAGIEAISLCEKPGFYQTLVEKTKQLTEPIKEIIEKKGLKMCLHQVGSLFTLFLGKTRVENYDDVRACNLKNFAEFFNTLFQRGVYLSPSQFEANFVSSAHSDETLYYTRDIIIDEYCKKYTTSS